MFRVYVRFPIEPFIQALHSTITRIRFSRNLGEFNRAQFPRARSSRSTAIPRRVCIVIAAITVPSIFTKRKNGGVARALVDDAANLFARVYGASVRACVYEVSSSTSIATDDDAAGSTRLRLWGRCVRASCITCSQFRRSRRPDFQRGEYANYRCGHVAFLRRGNRGEENWQGFTMIESRLSLDCP